ncbi:hypothetical protein PVL29_015812 [Vitis rotundifolia]|uniref:Uncharacterized protein n=1 Tax=Vitis rotundifolia TaxID=103349 RepID=A0AA38ZDN8_VITRO|nr:hypothetical protein PVL29_015812 [Vitis rotundifolia]
MLRVAHLPLVSLQGGREGNIFLKRRRRRGAFLAASSPTSLASAFNLQSGVVWIVKLNPETNVTQYERLERLGASSNASLAPPTKSSASISSLVQVQQASQGQRREYGLNEEDDKYNRARNLQQSAKGGTVHSHDPPNGIVGAGHGGSFVRG